MKDGVICESTLGKRWMQRPAMTVPLAKEIGVAPGARAPFENETEGNDQAAGH